MKRIFGSSAVDIGLLITGAAVLLGLIRENKKKDKRRYRKLRNFEKKAKRITKAVTEFVAEEFGPLREEDKIKKIGEFLQGFKRIKKINGTDLIILELPEGVKGAINSQGKLFDLNEIH